MTRGSIACMRRALALIAVAGCGGKDTCIEGACPVPCARLVYPCEPRDVKPLYAGRAADAPIAYRLARSHAADDDTLISNGIVTAVISAPENDNDLAPTGGNIIDYGPAGGVDDITIIYQLAGILPDDAFAYHELAIEQTTGLVAVTVRGTLDGRSDVKVATRYELGECDPGVRVRSELFNGSPETHAFFVADTHHAGKRRVLPFSPAPDQGYLAPELDLLELTDLWDPYDYNGGAAPNAESPAYGTVACTASTLSGVNDPEITALGTEIEFVEPGDTIVLERLLVTAGRGKGPGPALDEILGARAQLFDAPTGSATGRITAGGMPFGGDVRRASVIVFSDGRPVNAVVPDAEGRFSAIVPRDPGLPGELEVEVWSFGRPVARVAAPSGRAGDIDVPMPAKVQLEVLRGGVPDYAVVAFHPADEATRAAVTGTFHGRQDSCAPWLGPPQGGSPACNRVVLRPRDTELEVPAGRYVVYATAGPEHTLGREEVELVSGEIHSISFQLESLPITPAGWLSADLHVHGRASFDSGFPDADRVATFVAANVSVIAATDHDVIGDYADTVRTLGLDDRIAVMGGLEATQLIPWLDVPGSDLPRVIGHFNFWPLEQVPSSPRAGAPSDERIEPGELFDRMAPLVGDGGMMMLNHPWDEPLFGRDLGYLRAIDFDPRLAIDGRHMLLRRPAMQRRNIDWNLMEVLNGADSTELQKARVLWHSLIAQGFITAGAGNSDSHGLTDQQLGWARNWVDASTDVARFEASKFDAALRDGRFSAGNGVFVHVEVVSGTARRGTSLVPHAAQPGDQLAITVSAAPWIPVEEVRIVTSRGTRTLATRADLSHPTDPFGTAGIVRFTRTIPLTELVDRDDFIIVEAGLPYPLAADLDNDGVPDTGDNDFDGDVDTDDIEPDEDSGPLNPPPDPTDPADPRFLVTRVVPNAWPAGFANPVIVDLDGGGWTPPGVAR